MWATTVLRNFVLSSGVAELGSSRTPGLEKRAHRPELGDGGVRSGQRQWGLRRVVDSRVCDSADRSPAVVTDGGIYKVDDAAVAYRSDGTDTLTLVSVDGASLDPDRTPVRDTRGATVVAEIAADGASLDPHGALVENARTLTERALLGVSMHAVASDDALAEGHGHVRVGTDGASVVPEGVSPCQRHAEEVHGRAARRARDPRTVPDTAVVVLSQYVAERSVLERGRGR